MSDTSNHEISSLMDGELDAPERQRLIDGLSKDAELKGRWERYHLISDALRSNLPPAVDGGFAGRVMAALESEPTVLAPSRRSLHESPVVRRVAGFAIAASVAAIAVMGVQTLTETAPGGAQVAQMPPSTEYVRLAETPAVPLVSPVRTERDAQLDKYLVNHYQHSQGLAVQGMMPYARMVAYPVETQEQVKQ